MKDRKALLTVEGALLITITALAAWLRLANLGAWPLSDTESVHALAAASITPDASQFWHKGEECVPLSPAYHVFTAFIFQLFGASDAAARFTPAVAGLALVLTPLLVRRRLGRSTAVVLSFLFAISPALVTTARTAGGASLALLGVVTAIALLLGVEEGENDTKRVGWAAGALGLALASGPTIFHGLLTLSLGAIFFLALRSGSSRKHVEWLNGDKVRQSILITIGVMLVFACRFGFALSDVAGLAEALAAWISGWGDAGDTLALTTLMMLPIYEPLLLIFGIAGALAALRSKDALGFAFVTWAFGGLLLMMVYPAREGSDLIWVIVPLAALAARMLADLFERIACRQSWLEFAGLTCLLLVLSATFYLQLAAYTSGVGPVFDVMDRGIRLWISMGILFLGGVVIVLFGLGWSWTLAGESAGLAGCLTLLAFTISALWWLNFTPSGASAQELWRPQASTQGLRLMVDTVETISHSHTGRVDALDVKILGDVTPSLAWALRDFPQATSKGGVSDSPPVYIARDGEEMPGLGAEYTGQGLKISERWGWDGILPLDPIAWWIQRQTPTYPERWVLLVRLDIISLGESELSGFGVEQP